MTAGMIKGGEIRRNAIKKVLAKEDKEHPEGKRTKEEKHGCFCSFSMSA
jgi:hypothetical protein